MLPSETTWKPSENHHQGLQLAPPSTALVHINPCWPDDHKLPASIHWPVWPIICLTSFLFLTTSLSSCYPLRCKSWRQSWLPACFSYQSLCAFSIITVLHYPVHKSISHFLQIAVLAKLCKNKRKGIKGILGTVQRSRVWSWGNSTFLLIVCGVVMQISISL